MDQKVNQLWDSVHDIKSLIESFHATLESIENRLARLEKVDSIEHRVAVNQIDLSDIKDSLHRIEEFQEHVQKRVIASDEEVGAGGPDDVRYAHRRLDSHLVKIAKLEEEILILKSK